MLPLGPVFRATYAVEAPPADIDGRADALALEQTVELPRSALGEARAAEAAEQVLGRVERIEPRATGGYGVTIAYPMDTAAGDPAQLLNVVFGNSSLQTDVLLEDLELPDRAFDYLPGPRAGAEGWRRLTGVSGRPILATALKPMGLGPAELAELCRTFARAGLDLVKDDHGLADHPFCPFERRVTACLDAISDVARETGRRALYVPSLVGTPARVLDQLAFARSAGVQAVMISPMLVGLPFLHQLATEGAGFPILAHPSFAGTGRVSEVLLLGKLFRWFGADAVIFPHTGGRFSLSWETCGRIAEKLREPHARSRPALPVPAGGIRVERVPELLQLYGSECVLLIGSSLYEAGSRLFERTRAVVEGVARAAGEEPTT